jgi:ADP-ribose pyrophosphatase YjhB (NUDIX family)
VKCAACGREHWQNAKPCANALVVQDGGLLLVRRAHAPWRGSWCAPGGFCGAGEHPIDAAEREVYEETGLRVRAVRFVGIWLDRYCDPDETGEAETISVAYYEAEPVGGPETRPDAAEVSELRWFPLDRLPSDLAPPGTLRAVVDAWQSGRALADRPQC